MYKPMSVMCVFFCLAGQASADTEGRDAGGSRDGWYFSTADDMVHSLPLGEDEARRLELEAEALASSQCDSQESTLAKLYAGKTF